MSLLNLRQLHIAFGGPPILAGVDLRVERADRLCLVGRNGEGKSTLMKIISGEIQPDSGEQILEQQAHVARLDQDVPDGISGTVLDIARQGLRSGDPPHWADSAVTRLQQLYPPIGRSQPTRLASARAVGSTRLAAARRAY